MCDGNLVWNVGGTNCIGKKSSILYLTSENYLVDEVELVEINKVICSYFYLSAFNILN